MKLAVISAGLFLASYVAVNGGLGPHPLLLIFPVLVAVGSAAAARWFMRRNRAPGGGNRMPFDRDVMADGPPVRHVPRTPPASPPPRASGSKARKLF